MLWVLVFACLRVLDYELKVTAEFRLRVRGLSGVLAWVRLVCQILPCLALLLDDKPVIDRRALLTAQYIINSVLRMGNFAKTDPIDISYLLTQFHILLLNAIRPAIKNGLLIGEDDMQFFILAIDLPRILLHLLAIADERELVARRQLDH